VNLPSGAKWDAAVAHERTYVEAHREEVTAAESYLSAHAQPLMAQFQQTFPDFKCDFTFYIAPSFGQMDGSAAFVNGRHRIIFASDVSAPMSSKPARQCALVASILGILSVVVATTTGAATLEQETATKIEQIRAIKAGQNNATMATYNQEMDAAWKFYASHKPEILPILRAQLKTEINREQPSDLVLLDVGLFIHKNDSSEGKALAREALFHLNPRAAVVNENWKELFELVHGAAEDHDARVLDLIDRNFLTSDQKISYRSTRSSSMARSSAFFFTAPTEPTRRLT